MQVLAKILIFIVMVTIAIMVMICGFLKAMKSGKPTKIGIITSLLVVVINLIGSICVTII